MTKEFAATLVVLAMIAIAVPMFIRTAIWNRFLKNIKAEKDEEALKILNSPAFKIMFGEYNRKWNLMRYYISREKTEDVRNMTNALLYDNLSRQQAYQIFSNAYFYFISLQDQEMTAKILERLEPVLEEDSREQYQMLYRVMIEKKSEDIDRVLQLLEEKEKEAQSYSKASQEGMLQYLLGVQYANIGDKKESEKWLKKAKNNVKGTPLEKEIKKLLK
ncbi:MAG: hypothetical protein IKX74_05280 [Erysipelotrichaceae bacterium]|nr:hypothetical protein [Erysipelotrichaceae bacterium]MBO4538288.1 hypothetical protein [Erysipelotrichaceae bacterium]MBR5049031.1 hypothetical protein [Erysipelotrichaceae bacterium]